MTVGSVEVVVAVGNGPGLTKPVLAVVVGELVGVVVPDVAADVEVEVATMEGLVVTSAAARDTGVELDVDTKPVLEVPSRCP